jgi:molecular chaperone DnaJ
MAKQSPYDILSTEDLTITKNSSPADVKKAYRKAAKKWHPDRNQDNPESAQAKFQEATRANEILTDAAKKAAFDRGGYKAVDDLENGGNGSAEPRKSPNFKQHFGQEFGDAGTKPTAAAPANLAAGAAARRRKARAAKLDKF